LGEVIKGKDAVMSILIEDKEGHGRWRALLILSSTLIFSMSTWFSASAVLPQLRDLWGLSSNLSAWLTIAVQVGFVVGALISSYFNLSDILHPRLVIFYGSLGAAAANFLILFAEGGTQGILLRFFTGFFLAGVYPPSFKLISTWFREGRGLALGVLVAAIVTGNGLPPLNQGVGGLDWEIVLISTSLLTLAGGLISIFAGKEGSFPFPKAVFNPQEAGKVFRNRRVRLAIFGYMGHMWELFAMYAWIALFFFAKLETQDKYPVILGAYLTFLVFAMGGLGSWIGGILSDRWGRTQSTILMLSISGACAFVIGLLFDAPLWAVVLVSLVWGITVVSDSAQFSALVTEMADQSYVGTALTLQLASGFLVTVPIIWLLPTFISVVGWTWGFSLLVPGPVFGLISMWRLQVEQRKGF
jgi:MFS family permease